MKQKTIKSEATGDYKEKGSHFIAILKPIESFPEAENIIEQVRKNHHKARHVCYAIKIGAENPQVRIHDDGEPTYTAGQPILNQLNKYQLSNIIALVVRYFGGVLLGKGGLIRAYAQAVEEAVKNAEIVDIFQYVHFKVECEFEKYAFILEKLKKLGAESITSEFDKNCIITFKIPAENVENIYKFLDQNHLISESNGR